MALREEEIETFVTELKERSFGDARAVYGEKGFQRWRSPQFSVVMKKLTPPPAARQLGRCH